MSRRLVAILLTMGLIFASVPVLAFGVAQAGTSAGADAARCSGVTLHLQPGAQRVAAASNMPRDHVDLTAPLYPAATEVSASARAPLTDFSFTTDIKTAAAGFLASGKPAHVLDWYRSAFTGCGFTVESTGSGSGTGGSYQLVEFQSPSFRDAAVVLILRATGGNRTKVEYHAYAVTVASRPPSTLVRGRVRSVTITYQLPGTHGQPFHHTVSNPNSISQIRTAVNSLPLLPAGDIFAGPRITSTDSLRFTFTHHRPRTFAVTPAFILTRGATLQDQSGLVDRSIGLAAYAWLYQHR